MKLEKYYNLNVKSIKTKAKDKDELLQAIVDSALASDTLKNIDPKQLLKNLKARESIGSTGFGDGIAIPHCTLNDIDEFIVGALVSDEGLDFASIDGKPVKLFVYIIAPSKKRNEHIRVLSEIAKVLKVPAYVDELSAQTSASAFFKKLSEFGQWNSEEELPEEYSQLTIHIQDAKAFDQILELFAEVNDAYVSVIEGNNVGKYLYALPLFSHFMNEEHKGFHRLILAVINTIYVNDSLRKVGSIIEKLNCGSKVMITSHPLNFFHGGIDI